MGLTLLGYGDVLRARKKYPEAEASLLRGLAVEAKANGEDSASVQRALKAVVRLYTEWGKTDKAAAYQARVKPEAKKS